LVIGSGLGGGFQPAGGVTFCWLVPSPIAPGCWRLSPAVLAACLVERCAAADQRDDVAQTPRFFKVERGGCLGHPPLKLVQAVHPPPTRNRPIGRRQN
jgi:hypothetical protein